MTGNREFDLDWYDELSEDGQQRVTRWLARIPHDGIVTVELVDETALVGNLTVIMVVSGEEVLDYVTNVHWDDPFPEDAR